ncbi:DUF4381 domain-containing protein [Agaribacter flavus]|uniref:DUF4381 domain-containing protein n=1 Tax=Agaribacter flavus TaxID=1902781 RepID=A0ABV7FVC5_9ALTE
MNPLDQLADIQTPDSVAWWPLALGYWLVILLTLMLVTVASLYIFKRTKQRRARNVAIRQIQALDENAPNFALSIQHIVKLTVQAYLPDKPVSAWHSKQWKSVLAAGKLSKSAPDIVDTLYQLHTSLYSNSSAGLGEPAQIKKAAILWLKTELPALASSSRLGDMHNV